MSENPDRRRDWCFTLNNYTEEHLALLETLSKKALYLCYGKEVAPTTGTPHLQGYIYFKDTKTFSALKKKLPDGTHIERAEGNAQQNKVYCSKEGKFTEYGECPKQGKRNDISDIKEAVAQGKNMNQIIDIATNYQALKTAELILKYRERKRNWKPSVHWFYGPTGTGKTRKAYELCENPYRKTNRSGKWWDGYDAHSHVIIDDIKDDSREMYEDLLELLDRYDVRVEHKGGSRQFLATKIIVTSAEHPYELFKRFHQAKELLRRIDEITYIPNEDDDPDNVEEILD